MQSGNLYVYGVNNPVAFCDRNGCAGELALAWTGSMWWLPAIDGILPIGDIIYLGGIGVTAAIDSIGIDNIARFFSEVPNALQQLIQQAGDKAEAISDAAQQSASSSSPSPRGPNWGKGFKTFKMLKEYLGHPGKGNEWHHIVEQCQIKNSGFKAEIIQNVNNVVNISAETHRKISAFYSSKHSFTEGLTLRNWLAGQSFSVQYEWGLRILKMFGVDIS